MRKVEIVYNPFLLKTAITVDGKKPGANSSLDFEKLRLQEWAEKLPQILLDEYRDKNVTVEFTGTLDDFTDLKEILMANQLQLQFEGFVHHWTLDVEEVEKQVIQIYEEIMQGPVEALKDDTIQKTFEEAMCSEFAINVVATVSSGKSSLINALLGTNLMPVANMATTATIVRITASPQDYYSGIAFDAQGNEKYREERLSISIMRKWNADSEISFIEIYGPIPCVDSVGMRLVLVDTPGPNNSRDENHKKLTYRMLAESEKSLVLFVLNATQLNIDNEKDFLDDVCKCMKENGKQSRDRFIFAVNKLDMFKPKDGDNVEYSLNSVKQGLDERDIKEPNLFPVSAVVASEIRTDDDEPMARGNFAKKCEKGEEFHFEKYYAFNHLPLSSRIRLAALIKGENAVSELELHSGIPSIEEAIRLYVNKYARTIKVKDLVDAFNQRLTELKTEAEIMNSIQRDKEAKAILDAEISKIQEEIESGNSAKEYAALIDRIDVMEDVRKEMDYLVGGIQKRIDDILFKYNTQTKVLKEEAIKEVEPLMEEKKDIHSQMEVRLMEIFVNTFKRTYDKIMDVYRERLKKLGMESSGGNVELNLLDFVGQEISNIDIDALIRKSTQTEDEGKEETRSREVKGKKKINWIWKPSTWFTERYETKIEYYTVHVPKNVDYVNMQQVANDFFVSMQTDLISLEKDVPERLAAQTADLKKNIKEEIVKIEEVLKQKLNVIRDRIHESEKAAEQIAEQEYQLNWMREIVARVNQLISY